ncbi:MAG: Rpn family recombination-promoting nuclease/putative transposase [Clostridia bacterium]|nr:Rpn family recombination-promoting nuclease/putative transposase [Clostridia bacterium]
MGAKDIAEKNLEAFNDVFADIVNVLLFKGKHLMKEKDLESATKDSMFKADGKIHEQERDVSKFWKNGEVRISILGFENQTVQDYNMPLRIIGYDGASYKMQVNDKDLKKKYPVATLVLYFGTEKKWTAPKNLLGCFKVPDELKPFVSDYKINVFNIAWLSKETVDMFRSDFKFVAQYFRAKRLNKNYIPTEEEIKHADELFKMFTALTGDKFFEMAYNEVISNKKGGITMCDIVQGFVQEGRDQGKAELVRKMLDAKLVTEQQIADLLKISVKEVKKIAAKVPVEA